MLAPWRVTPPWAQLTWRWTPERVHSHIPPLRLVSRGRRRMRKVQQLLMTSRAAEMTPHGVILRYPRRSPRLGPPPGPETAPVDQAAGGAPAAADQGGEGSAEVAAEDTDSSEFQPQGGARRKRPRARKLDIEFASPQRAREPEREERVGKTDALVQGAIPAVKARYAKCGAPRRAALGASSEVPIWAYEPFRDYKIPQGDADLWPEPLPDGHYRCPFCPQDLEGFQAALQSECPHGRYILECWGVGQAHRPVPLPLR